MSLAYHIVTLTIKGLTALLCDIDDAQLARIPDRGPLILVANHVNFLDIPVVYPRLRTQSIAGLVKAETWDNPFMAVLFNLWGGIPIHRGEADKEAFRQALEALGRGQIVAISPEGTRSGNGCLQRGHPGIALLAQHSGAPVIPLVCYGGESFKHNLSRLRRTDFHVRVGKPFTIQAGRGKITRLIRRQITDEIMYRLAAMLPPAYRGVYGDLDRATEQYLQYL